MKRALILCGLLFCLAAQAWAGDDIVTSSFTAADDDVTVLEFDYTADSSGATVSPTASSGTATGYVFMVVTDPGSPAPTDDYDVALLDGDGADILGGAGANRDQADSEQITPAIGGAYAPRFVNGALTLQVTGNAVNSAQGKVKIFIRRKF